MNSSSGRLSHWMAKKSNYGPEGTPHPEIHFRKTKTGNLWVEFDADKPNNALHKYSERRRAAGEVQLVDVARQAFVKLTNQGAFIRQKDDNKYHPLYVGHWLAGKHRHSSHLSKSAYQSIKATPHPSYKPHRTTSTPSTLFSRSHGPFRSGGALSAIEEGEENSGLSFSDFNGSDLPSGDPEFLEKYGCQLMDITCALYWLANNAKIQHNDMIIVPFENRRPDISRNGTGGYSEAYIACGLSRPEDLLKKRRFHDWQIAPPKLIRVQNVLRQYIGKIQQDESLANVFLNRQRGKDEFARTETAFQVQKPKSFKERLSTFASRPSTNVPDFHRSTKPDPSRLEFACPFTELGVYYVNFGEIPDNPSKCHTEQCIYPVGFTTRRLHQSFVTPSKRVTYESEVFWDNGSKFRVTAEDAPDEPCEGFSTCQAWRGVEERIAKRQGTAVKIPINGDELFGLNAPIIAKAIEKMENADKCKRYKSKYLKKPFAITSLFKRSTKEKITVPQTEDEYREILEQHKDQFVYTNAALRFLFVYCAQNIHKASIPLMVVPIGKRCPEYYHKAFLKLGLSRTDEDARKGEWVNWNAEKLHLENLRDALRGVSKDVPATEFYRESPFDTNLDKQKDATNRQPTHFGKEKCKLCNRVFFSNQMDSHMKLIHGDTLDGLPFSPIPVVRGDSSFDYTPMTPLVLDTPQPRKRTRSSSLIPTRFGGRVDNNDLTKKFEDAGNTSFDFLAPQTRIPTTLAERQPRKLVPRTRKVRKDDDSKKLFGYKVKTEEIDDRLLHLGKKRNQHLAELDRIQAESSRLSKNRNIYVQKSEVLQAKKQKTQDTTCRYVGVCTKWVPGIGYGFVEASGVGDAYQSTQLYVSKHSLPANVSELQDGMKLSFRIVVDKDAGLRAEEIQVISETAYKEGFGANRWISNPIPNPTIPNPNPNVLFAPSAVAFAPAPSSGSAHSAQETRLKAIQLLKSSIAEAEIRMKDAANNQKFAEAQKYQEKIQEYKKELAQVVRKHEKEESRKLAEAQAKSKSYKTELCRDHPNCPRGDSCQFAHGDGELRQPSTAQKNATSRPASAVLAELPPQNLDINKLRQCLQAADHNERVFELQKQQTELQAKLAAKKSKLGIPVGGRTIIASKGGLAMEVDSENLPIPPSAVAGTYRGKFMGFDPSKQRFGYLKSPAFKERVYFEQPDLNGPFPNLDDEVEFSIFKTDKGRRAKNITPVRLADRLG